MRSRIALLVGLVVLGAGCSEEAGPSAGGTTVERDPEAGDTNGAGDAADPAGDGEGEAGPEPTFAPVRSTVVGAAVGGSAGATGAESTDPFSEAVRNADGTCSGWDGPGGTWTQGLESGAPVVFLARDQDVDIGTGTLGTSRWEDVGTAREQWNCVFPFEGEIDGAPDAFRIVVADLPPWVVHRDPTDPSRWLVSIDTIARFDVFDECTAPDRAVAEVAPWDSFGVFWSRGIPHVCGAGLAVVDIERPCRPPNVASEHIVMVTRADDPTAVLEDASGLRVDPATVAPLTEVVVHVATGRSC